MLFFRLKKKIEKILNILDPLKLNLKMEILVRLENILDFKEVTEARIK